MPSMFQSTRGLCSAINQHAVFILQSTRDLCLYQHAIYVSINTRSMFQAKPWSHHSLPLVLLSLKHHSCACTSYHSSIYQYLPPITSLPFFGATFLEAPQLRLHVIITVSFINTYHWSHFSLSLVLPSLKHHSCACTTWSTTWSTTVALAPLEAPL